MGKLQSKPTQNQHWSVSYLAAMESNDKVNWVFVVLGQLKKNLQRYVTTLLAILSTGITCDQ